MCKTHRTVCSKKSFGIFTVGYHVLLLGFMQVLTKIVKFRIRRVGEEGLEPPVSLENGFTVRAATSYRLLSQI